MKETFKKGEESVNGTLGNRSVEEVGVRLCEPGNMCNQRSKESLKPIREVSSFKQPETNTKHPNH